ncbi:MAG TPA: carboxylating nicotinate-nucleotide diphosphorylase [Sporosarcina sp.]|nr:carboxylating nicotinate-nucleotide diphosphorylase [Sporosarcina sp.]
MNKVKLRSMMEQFLAEDIGDYDVTTQAVFEEDTTGTLILLAKEEGIFSGEMVISTGFSMIDSNVSISLFVKDGETITKGQQLAKVTGHVQALLTGERVVLNIIQRMSGIATLTKDAVTRLHSAHTRICDTRKTTPGFRLFEKYAVRCGGGFNHRMGLYDGIMIKDNHIDFCGSITKAVERVRKSVGHMVKIEVETESAEQVKEAVVAGVDIIMFDNRSPEEIKELLALVPPTIITEASGGITLEQLEAYGTTGVDYISLGCLTHAYQALDISAIVQIEGEQ